MKECKKCQTELPIEEFYKHKAMADGHLSFCRSCVKARVRKHKGRDSVPGLTPRYESAKDRFMAKVVVESSGCWRWTGHVTGDGYGMFSEGSRAVSAHRYAYRTFLCPIPDRMELDHLCRVRDCVNPAHLEPVTHAVNVQRGQAGYPYRDVPSPSGAKANADKDHCPKGHPYAQKSSGRRCCVTCRRDWQRADYWRRREVLTTQAVHP